MKISVIIVDAALSQGEKETTVKDVSQIIEKCGGRVINSQVWIEKQKMAFLMKKRPEGTYYLLNFEGGKEKFDDFMHTLLTVLNQGHSLEIRLPFLDYRLIDFRQ